MRGLGFFNEAVIGTLACALDERAESRRTPESWQACAIGAPPRNVATR
jgi:hypothetical protein